MFVFPHFFVAFIAALLHVCFADERMTIDIGTRSYDGKMWFCADKKDRPIPAKYATPESRREQSFADLPANERPMMRTLKNGVVEPDVLDDGNAWVAFLNADGQRRAFVVSSDGFHSVCTKCGGGSVPQIEAVSGVDYIIEVPYLTVPTTFEQLKKIARRVGGNKKIDEGSVDKNRNLYKGTDFVLDLVLAVVDDHTQTYLRASANNWPIPIQLLDYHYYEKHGQSAFEKHDIPGEFVPPPSRSWLSRLQTINAQRNSTTSNSTKCC